MTTLKEFSEVFADCKISIKTFTKEIKTFKEQVKEVNTSNLIALKKLHSIAMQLERLKSSLKKSEKKEFYGAFFSLMPVSIKNSKHNIYGLRILSELTWKQLSSWYKKKQLTSLNPKRIATLYQADHKPKKPKTDKDKTDKDKPSDNENQEQQDLIWFTEQILSLRNRIEINEVIEVETDFDLLIESIDALRFAAVKRREEILKTCKKNAA